MGFFRAINVTIPFVYDIFLDVVWKRMIGMESHLITKTAPGKMSGAVFVAIQLFVVLSLSDLYNSFAIAS